jgi:ATP-binding cassette subfamily B protein
MKYTLSTIDKPLNAIPEQGMPWLRVVKKLWPLMRQEKKILLVSLLFMVINSGVNLAAPRISAHVIDKYIPVGDFHGILVMAGILIGMYIVGFFASYLQTLLMGGVGQRVLFNLRNAVFNKLQSLPVAFFNQNKAGDLISRINNDTDKLNQFFSQSLMQFVGSIFIMIGAAIFLVSINVELGLTTLAPAAVLVIFTELTSAWIKRKNATNMRALGGMSSEIQESLNNFKVIIAFNRRDYFRQRFKESNDVNYQAAVGAGIANNTYTPVYGLSANIAQMMVIAFGTFLITQHEFTIGLLISFLAYASNFYNPLRQLAALWANFQVAMAGWDRISEILGLESDLTLVPPTVEGAGAVIEFRNVGFGYPEGKQVLHDINFKLERGKTYALVGPTGGGKTTTASLMARLYDPTSGTVLLDGKDIRSYNPEDRANKIGFILQEPYLFTGTVRDNIVYGNDAYKKLSNEAVAAALNEAGLGNLLARFDKGLDTPVLSSGDTISLGQKQIIAFMRAVLRKPEIMILDEATANIDTVTEQVLEGILKKLPPETTKVIIAHRLNTIENADEIFFVNGGSVTPAGSMEHAMELLLHGHRQS